jgi:hypothetical protein
VATDFFFPIALGLTQPLIKWVPGAFSLGVRRLGRETDHPPPSNAEVKRYDDKMVMK